MTHDLMCSSVRRSIIKFSLPYLLSYFLQTLYGMADLYFVGRFDTVTSTTAVSVGSQVMHMLTVMIVGLAMGTTVTVAAAVGADDTKRASRSKRSLVFCSSYRLQCSQRSRHSVLSV